LSTQEHALIKTLRCPTCGAPLKPSAESILIICNFCGEIITESPISPHAIIKPLPLTPPEGLGQIKKMELILVPFFEVKAQVDMEALGYQRRERTETRTVRRGGETHIETRTIVEYRPWRIEHHGAHAVRFLARQEITMFGADELQASVAKSLGGEPLPFSAQLIKDLVSRNDSHSLVALSPEWSQSEAVAKAGETVYEAAYARAKSEMHEVFDTRVNFKPLAKPTLVHEPLLLVRRKIQGRSYRAAYHWGNGQLLREELPIKNRGLMIFFALLMFLGTPFLTQVGYNRYLASGENFIIILFVVLSVIVLGIGIFLVVRAYKPHKVKSSGGKITLFDFQKIAPGTQPQPQLQRRPTGAPSESGSRPIPKFCPKCGDPLEPGQVFCEKCGYKIEQR